MAEGRSKEIWLIVLLVIVAVFFAVMAFTKEKPKAPEVKPPDMLAMAPAAPAAMQPAQPVAIKPDHSVQDQAAVAAVKPVSAIVEMPQQVPSKLTLAVQVYSFKEKLRADAALAKLLGKGYKAYIMVSDLGVRGIWYRVRVGTFGTEEEAHKALENITSDFKSGIIVTE